MSDFSKFFGDTARKRGH